MLMSTRIFAAAVGLDRATLSTFLRDNQALVPAKKNKTKRDGDWFSLSQAVALNLSRSLKRRGIQAESCGNLLLYLWTMSDPAFEQALERGISWLAVLGGAVLPRLMKENMARNPLGLADKLDELGVSLAVLDVRPHAQRIKATAAQLMAEESPSLELESV